MHVMSSVDQVPEAIREAKRINRNAMLASFGFAVGWIPLVGLGKSIGFDTGSMILGWFGLMGVAAFFTNWGKVNQAYALLKAYDEQQAEEALANAVPSLDTDDPMHAIASRIKDLAQGDEAVLKLVDDLLLQVNKAQQDLVSLTDAVQAEVELGGAEDGPRLARLQAVAGAKQRVMDQLSGAMRDLHVELTVRQNDDHGDLISQVRDVLDGISAETEVEQVMATPRIAETPTVQADESEQPASEHHLSNAQQEEVESS